MSSKRDVYGNVVKKAVGYYATKKEAIEALDAYNVDPYALGEDQTLNTIFEQWIKEYENIAVPKTVKVYTYTWKLWKPFFDRTVRSIRASELQILMDTIDKTPSTKAAMKKVITNVFEFAIKNDMALKNPGTYLYVPSRNQDEAKRPHIPYTDTEIQLLWDHQEDDMAALQLILIYCGCRIGEIIGLDTADINTEEKTFLIRQAKTKAGIRTVPIADKAFHLWERFLARGGTRLIVSDFGNEIKYQAIRVNWDRFNESIGIKHMPHDCRHTAITKMTAAGIDDRIIKKVVGHKANNVTVDVYTHFDMDELRDAVNRI